MGMSMSGSETLSITVPTGLAEALRQAVEAGEFAAVDDAVADALTAWADRHTDREEDLAWVRAKIRASIADPRPGLSAGQVRAYMKTVSARSRADDDAAA